MMMSFEKISSKLAIASGVLIFLYSLSFVVVSKNSPILGAALAALFLMVFGVVSSGAWIGIYGRLKEVSPGFAAWTLFLGLAAAVGALVHGGYDLTNVLNPPAVLPTDLASQIDPRGLLTFGLSGLALMLASVLISSGKNLSKNLGNLGYVAGLLSIFVYLGRLIIVDATSLVITVPALIAGFVAVPLWYLWIGLVLKPSEYVAPIEEVEVVETKNVGRLKRKILK